MNPVAHGRAMRGMTLIELVIAITVIGIAVSSVLAVFSAQATRSAETMIRAQAAGIASAYLNEILQKNFIAIPNCCGRATFNDIGDYHAPPFNVVSDQSGNAVPGLNQFRVSVTIGPGMLPGIPPNDVLLVNVIVNHTSGARVLIDGYRTR